MKDQQLNIETFHKLLQGNQESPVLSVLRKLTEVKQTQALSDGIPQPGPLGSWSGWGL